jgi:uncharacterized CHY-type Zn-finger protein
LKKDGLDQGEAIGTGGSCETKTDLGISVMRARESAFTGNHPGTFRFFIILMVVQWCVLSAPLSAQDRVTPPENAMCLGCHNMAGFGMPGPDGEKRDLHVTADKFNASVHGVQKCVSCHEDIAGVPHEKGVEHQVGCVQCHRDLWDEARLAGEEGHEAKLGEVVLQIESYMNSVHARPSMADQRRTNATCYDCHDAHYIKPINGDELDRPLRLATPEVCGNCHSEIAAAYQASVHGMAAQYRFTGTGHQQAGDYRELRQLPRGCRGLLHAYLSWQGQSAGLCVYGQVF